MKAIVSLAALLIASASVAETPNRATCEYFNTKTDEMISKACTSTWEGDSEIVRIGTRRFVIAQKDRQGVWATITFNGKPGMRYETDRETYSYATSDLTEFLDVKL